MKYIFKIFHKNFNFEFFYKKNFKIFENDTINVEIATNTTIVI